MYSTENYIQYTVKTYNRNESEKYVCIYVYTHIYV